MTASVFLPVNRVNEARAILRSWPVEAEFIYQDVLSKMHCGSDFVELQLDSPPKELIDELCTLATVKPSVSDKPITAHTILHDAANAVQQRASERDMKDERSMGRCVQAFNALTGHALTERDGWLLMVVLKASRATATPNGKLDDYIDMAAYAGLAGESVA